MKLKYIVSLLLALFAADNLLACSCIPVSLESEVRDTPAIFQGIVKKLEVVAVTAEGFSTIEATVEVENVFKGDVPRLVVFTTSNGCCFCAYSFEIAESYVFFARRNDTRFVTSTCARTKPTAKAGEELNFLANRPRA